MLKVWLNETNFLFQSGVPTRPGGNNFELETDNDNWPEVDLGNLIFDLDADIDKTTTTATMSSTNTTSATGSGTITINSRTLVVYHGSTL